MNKETVKAIKGSIRKWEKILCGTGVDKGTDNCPLCQKFLKLNRKTGSYECFKCPVYKKTGKHTCDGSPYEDFVNAPRGDQEIIPARKEVDFLRSLLPPVKEKRSRR